MGWSRVGRHGCGRASIAVVAAIWTVGCLDAVEPSGVVLIEALTDTVLSGVVAQSVSTPSRVLVTDVRGEPLAGVAVSFTTKQGSVEFPVVVTASDGLASPGVWTLGPAVGRQTMSARAGFDRVVFVASVHPGAPEELWVVGGAFQSGAPGTELPLPLTVQAIDYFGNPVPGFPVTFTVLTGGGLVASAPVTDSVGRASATWTLGPAAGLQEVRVETGTAVTTFSAVASCVLGSGPCGAELAVPCAAPDECGRIVFVSSRDVDAEIYSVRANGTDLVRLTGNPASDTSPAWSPDGDRIAFVSDRTGLAQVHVMDADGSNVVQLTDEARGASDPAWSADGKTVVYAASGNSDIWSVSADPDSLGVPPTPLFTRGGEDLAPAWSPDGTRLALVSDWNAFDFVQDVYLWTPGEDEADAVDLTGGAFDRVDYSNPSWSPDGETLAIAITNTTSFGTYQETFGTVLGLLDASGGVPRPLFAASSFTVSSWSPDGEHIAFTGMTPDGGTSIAWIRADGSEAGVILVDGHSPDWGP